MKRLLPHNEVNVINGETAMDVEESLEIAGSVGQLLANVKGGSIWCNPVVSPNLQDPILHLCKMVRAVALVTLQKQIGSSFPWHNNDKPNLSALQGLIFLASVCCRT